MSTAQEIVGNILRDMMQSERRIEADAAARDPEAHKFSRVFDNASYRYFKTRNRRGSEVRFCYSVHRNVAGYFLGWTETLTAKKAERTDWHCSKSKRDIVDRCRRHVREARAKWGKSA